MTSNGGDADPLLRAEISPPTSDDNPQQQHQQTNDDDNDKRKIGRRGGRRLFSVWGLSSLFRFRIPSRQKLEAFITPGRRMDAWCSLMHYCVESVVYLLGPLLICLASSIIGLLVYTYFAIVKDMLWLYYADVWYASYVIHTHTTAVLYLMMSVIYNYALCVCTSNIKGKSYNKVMREMATATGFVFPESPAEVERFRKDYEDRMVLRMQCRRQRAIDAANRKSNAIATNAGGGGSDTVTQRKNAATANGGSTGGSSATANNDNNPIPTTVTASTTTTTTTTTTPAQQAVRPWMLMGPLEWGFCNRTQQPKPPRAHYCHVSKGLVFCLDHYCPWMFTVGYFNYRYFVNFLIFACVSMLYGASLTYAPFILLSTNKYREQLRANKHHFKVSNDPHPLPRMSPFLAYPNEKMYITLTFMLSLAVGLAVAMLCFFHIYLTLTSQTTIEFHGNMTNSRRAKKAGKKWKNPYSFGFLRNFQQVYGSQYHPLLAILIPSSREPEFLPVPQLGERAKGERSKKQRESSDFVV